MDWCPMQRELMTLIRLAPGKSKVSKPDSCALWHDEGFKLIKLILILNLYKKDSFPYSILSHLALLFMKCLGQLDIILCTKISLVLR